MSHNQSGTDLCNVTDGAKACPGGKEKEGINKF